MGLASDCCAAISPPTLLIGGLDKVYKSGISSPVVWGPPSRDDQCIKILEEGRRGEERGGGWEGEEREGEKGRGEGRRGGEGRGGGEERGRKGEEREGVGG